MPSLPTDAESFVPIFPLFAFLVLSKTAMMNGRQEILFVSFMRQTHTDRNILFYIARVLFKYDAGHA